MSKKAVIFPGQGSQLVGMGHDVAEASSRARSVFERANEIVGYDLTALCFEGPAEELEKTAMQQPAIFVTSVALWEAFLERGGRKDQFCRAGGLSLGEYTALYVAGAISFDDALKLVHRRGRLMQAAAEAAPSGMVSLIGADEKAAMALCERARADEILSPANFNCPGQIVISGSRGACDRAVTLAGEFGCRALPLSVAGAFHSPLMESAAAGLASVLKETPFSRPSLPVVANVDGLYHADAAGIRQSLYQQVTQPVLWQKCIERIIQDGVDVVVEVGPGRVLTGLMRKIDRGIAAINVSTLELAADAVACLNSTGSGSG